VKNEIGPAAAGLVALTRAVPAAINRCELTHIAREPIDLERAGQQHRQYEEALARAGCRLEHARPEPELPDSVFVEDPAVVLDELAVVTRPGAASRRTETVSVAEALAPYRRLRAIHEPGTLDGGDVLVIGRTIYVGLGTRTNLEGVRQLEGLVAPHGYRVLPIELRGCLHLKTAVTQASPSAVLINPAWVDPLSFGDMERIEIDPAEPFAANVLLVGDTLLCGAGYPRTRARLERRGIVGTAIDLSELAKAEAALTCCSIVFRDEGSGTRDEGAEDHADR
jgi:dimethylargininase